VGAIVDKWFKDLEHFDGQNLLDFNRAHPEIPIFICVLYLLFVHQVPQLIASPMNLKTLNSIWDLILAVFSIVGAFYTVPTLLRALTTKGYVYTICEDPHNWYGMGPSGFFVCSFIYSKIPELLDTVFLVLQKKRVIFLHWFHHLTVLLYCWHAHHHEISCGLWFAAMNYSVHAVMYTYYFLMTTRLRKYVKKVAPIITSLQLLQMVVGVTVTVIAATFVFEDQASCHADAGNLKLGLAMYASYLVLFAVLFHNLYIKKDSSKHMSTGCPDIANSMQVSDSAGFFHDEKNADGQKSSESKKSK